MEDNLLSNIDEDLIITNILPRMPINTSKDFVSSIRNASKKLKNFDTNNEYWRSKVETDLNNNKTIKGNYNVDYKTVYDTLSHNYKDKSILSVDNHGNTIIISKDKRVNIDELVNPKVDNPDYIALAVEILDNMPPKISKNNKKKKKNKRSEKAELLNSALSHAISYDHVNIVKYLIDVHNMDIDNEEENLLYELAANGGIKIIKMLLSDDKYDPSTDDNEALRNAIAGNQPEVVKIFLDDPRVNLDSDYADNIDIFNAIIEEVEGDNDPNQVDKLKNDIVEDSVAGAVDYAMSRYFMDREAEYKLDEIHLRYSDMFKVIKVLLDHNKSSQYMMKFMSDIDVWVDYLKSIYNIDIKENDKVLKGLINLYKRIRSIELLLNNYASIVKENKDKIDEIYTTTRNKLGELLGDADEYEFNYLIKIGAPITYNDGQALCLAIKNRNIEVLGLIDSNRLTYFMSNETRAWNLIKTIADLKWRTAKMLFDYLFKYDTNKNIDIYKRLVREYRTNRELVRYINNKLI